MLAARRRLDDTVRLAFGLYAWGTFIALGALALGLAMLYRRANRIWRVNHHMARRLLAACRIPMQVTWERAPDLRAPHVIVANHSSYLDAVILSALLGERHRFVAKAELARAPLVGRYLQRLQTLFIDRASGRSASEVDRLGKALANGDSLVMFPEGTFTAVTGVRTFYLGAFRAAAAAGAAVVPLALCGVRPLLRERQWLPRRLPVRAVIGVPLTARPQEEPLAAAIRMRDAARAHVLRHCGEPDLSVFESADVGSSRKGG